MRNFIWVVIFSFASQFAIAQDAFTEVDGLYDGRNFYVQNPAMVTDHGKKFCVKKIFVNKKEISFADDIAIEVNLTPFKLKIGDSLNIKIIHSADCTPKILHQHYYPPKKIRSIKLEGDSVLRWTALGDSVKYNFVLQQFRWNRWIDWDSIQNILEKDSTRHSFRIHKYLHSGVNTFRVKGSSSISKNYSNPVLISEKDDGDILTSSLKGNKKKPVTFKKATHYQLYDKFGNKVKEGFGTSFAITDLGADIYYLNYDDRSVELTINN